MSASYNLGLVLLSYLVASFAAFTALDLAGKVGGSDQRRARAWLFGGALVMGMGIWAMRFIGMLALDLPVRLAYELPITLASMVPAVLASGLALALWRRPVLGPRLHFAGALAMGLGIATMHYSGMEAIRMEPDFGYHWGLVAASVAIAVAASHVALGIALRLRERPGAFAPRAAAALVMGLAIFAMHYTGMAATQFAAGSVCLSTPSGVDPEWLAVMVGLGSGLMLLATLLLSTRELRQLEHQHAADAELLLRASELAESMGADLRAREQHTRAIIDSALDAIVTMDEAGRIVEFNPAAEAMLGYQREEVLGRQLADCIVPPALRDAHRQGLARYLAGGEARVLGRRIEIHAWHRAGQEIPVELTVTSTPLGGRSAFTAHLRDLRPRRAAEQSLRLRGLALDSVDCGICIVDQRRGDPLIEYLNAAFERISGWPAAELLGEHPLPRLGALFDAAADGQTRRRLLLQRPQAEPLWCEQFCTLLRDADGRVTHTVLLLNDASSSVQHEQQLEQLASFDALTGLPNRLQLRARLDQRIVQTGMAGGGFAVLFVDLDHFKVINDSLGHDVGDELLKVLALRLKSCVRDGDLVARLGGDEFVMLVGLASGQEAGIEAVLRRIRDRVAEPVELQERSLHVTCSIGQSRYPADGLDAETLLRKADAAMYLAKREGRNEARQFTGELEQALRERLEIEGDLRQALAGKELLLHFQPLVALQGSRLAGAEVLLRWQHPRRGLLLPGCFIALAEETGLILPLGDWVLREACRQALHWRTADGRPLQLSVNLSPRQLRDPGFVARVADILHETGFAAGRLEFELTESLFTEESEAVAAAMRELAALGLRLAIDDFGTGYSNLRYLKRFPVSRLKIDRSFVAQLGQDDGDAAIATAIISLAGGLGFDVVGEGVETEAQRQWLRAAGCGLAQGYLFGRPMPADAFGDLLAVGLLAGG